ncbi:MAG: hypothetical protein AB2A00_41740 [Myxococcota bacterium]
MDLLRGLALPVLLALMALSLGYLGTVSDGDARILAERAATLSAPDPNSVAPRAEAEARRRALLKRAHEARIQGTALYGGAGLLAAIAGLLVVSHLRMFRGLSTQVRMVEVRPISPDGPRKS